jgi:addiction module HigA family antidote
MAMKNPVHPGAIVREDCMKPLNLSVTECAKMLGVARQTLSNLVNEKVSVSIEMAYRLSKAFGSTPRTWLGMQLAFDLAQSQDLEQKIKVNRISMERQSR